MAREHSALNEDNNGNYQAQNTIPSVKSGRRLSNINMVASAAVQKTNVPFLYWCEPCKISLNIPALVDRHLASKKHLENMSNLNGQSANVGIMDDSQLYCNICNVGFNNKMQSIKHSYSKKHKKCCISQGVDHSTQLLYKVMTPPFNGLYYMHPRNIVMPQIAVSTPVICPKYIIPVSQSSVPMSPSSTFAYADTPENPLSNNFVTQQSNETVYQQQPLFYYNYYNPQQSPEMSRYYNIPSPELQDYYTISPELHNYYGISSPEMQQAGYVGLQEYQHCQQTTYLANSPYTPTSDIDNQPSITPVHSFMPIPFEEEYDTQNIYTSIVQPQSILIENPYLVLDEQETPSYDDIQESQNVNKIETTDIKTVSSAELKFDNETKNSAVITSQINNSISLNEMNTPHSFTRAEDINEINTNLGKCMLSNDEEFKSKGANSDMYNIKDVTEYTTLSNSETTEKTMSENKKTKLVNAKEFQPPKEQKPPTIYKKEPKCPSNTTYISNGNKKLNKPFIEQKQQLRSYPNRNNDYTDDGMNGEQPTIIKTQYFRPRQYGKRNKKFNFA